MIQLWPGDASLPVADRGGASDGTRCWKRASHPAEALEEEPRRAEFQTASEDARGAARHAGRAAQAPGPAAEPHHCSGGASAPCATDEGQGGEEEQEEEEREEIQARRGDP